MDRRRIVITGFGPVSSIGTGAEAFWSSLAAGAVGVGRIEAFDASGFRTQIAGEIRDVKCRDHVPKTYRKSTKVMARDIELAVIAADCAVRHAGLTTKGIDPDNVQVEPTRMGVNIGAGLICADLTELAGAFSAATVDGTFDLGAWGQEGMTHLTPLWLLKYLPNMLACHVSIIHDAQAPSNTITCAEASGLLALAEACETIGRDMADVCLAGGAESKLNAMGLLRQGLAGRLTESHNDDPAGAVRPYDASRDGMVIGEGGGVVVLEELAHARNRGATIYGEILGSASGCSLGDLHGIEADGQTVGQVVREALEEASVEPGDLDLVVGFGAGLPLFDRAEANGLRSALGDHADRIPVFSNKGQIGCCGAGAGALDMITAVQIMDEAVVPAVVNCDTVGEDCPICPVTGSAVASSPSTALVVGYALGGGQVAAMVIRKDV